MGVRGAWRFDRWDLPVGQRVQARRKRMANSHQGHFPDLDTAEDRYLGNCAGGAVPSERLRPLRRRRQRLGMGKRLVSAGLLRSARAAGPVARNPPVLHTSFDPSETEKKRVHRGGSFLCTDEYSRATWSARAARAKVSRHQSPRLPPREGALTNRPTVPRRSSGARERDHRLDVVRPPRQRAP